MSREMDIRLMDVKDLYITIMKSVAPYNALLKPFIAYDRLHLKTESLKAISDRYPGITCDAILQDIKMSICEIYRFPAYFDIYNLDNGNSIGLLPCNAQVGRVDNIIEEVLKDIGIDIDDIRNPLGVMDRLGGEVYAVFGNNQTLNNHEYHIEYIVIDKTWNKNINIYSVLENHGVKPHSWGNFGLSNNWENFYVGRITELDVEKFLSFLKVISNIKLAGVDIIELISND